MYHKNLLQDCVWSVTPYESESWTLSKTEKKTFRRLKRGVTGGHLE